MKTNSRLFLLTGGLYLLLTFQLFAQTAQTDIIIRRDNTKINALVSEVGEHDVKYKKVENPGGPLYSISKSQILTILYRNGEVENFTAYLGPQPDGRQPAGSESNTEPDDPNVTRKSVTQSEKIPEATTPPRNSFERNIRKLRSDELRTEYARYRSKGNHGMVMGIIFTGIGVAAIGVGAALASDPYYSDDYDFYYDEERYIGGIAAIVGGAALAGSLGTVGWIKMARNKSKARTVASELTRRQEHALSLKLTPGYNFATRAGSLTFQLRF